MRRTTGIGFLLSTTLFAAACLKPPGVRYPELPAVADGALQIISFDVGQADATLVLYRGKSLLIDCGAPLTQPMRASRRIPRRLDALIGSRHLDYFLLTHYHQDHVGAPSHRRNQRKPAGLFSLIERDGVTIGTLLDRGFWSATAEGGTQKSYERALRQWLASGVVHARREVHAGDRIDMGPGLDVEVVVAAGNGHLGRLQALFPAFVEENPPSENDYSIGLKITLGDFELFTAGDLSGRNVVRRHGPRTQSYNDIESPTAKLVGAVELYRVNHHGSRHSTNPCFAQVLHPLISVISTGENGYGHPDPEVVRRLRSYGDVVITGGAAPAVRSEVEAFVAGDDVDVLVAPAGDRFWVNGVEYRSLSDAEEAARPDSRALCDDPEGTPVRPESFPVEESDGDTD